MQLRHIIGGCLLILALIKFGLIITAFIVIVIIIALNHFSPKNSEHIDACDDNYDSYINQHYDYDGESDRYYDDDDDYIPPPTKP